MLQLHKFKILNSSKTWPHRENLTTVLKSAPLNYPENALKLQSPWNSFKIVDLCNSKTLRVQLAGYCFKRECSFHAKAKDSCGVVCLLRKFGPSCWCRSKNKNSKSCKLRTHSQKKYCVGFSKDMVGRKVISSCISSVCQDIEQATVYTLGFTFSFSVLFNFCLVKPRCFCWCV